MPKINNIEDMSARMREGAVRLVMANYLENEQSFSKYDITSGVRALLAQIADFTHDDVREFIGDEMQVFVNQGVDYNDSIVDGPTGEYILYAPNVKSDGVGTNSDETTEENTEPNTDVDTFDTMWIDLINDGIVENDKVEVVKFDTNIYKITFDTGVFILLITNGQKVFRSATIHTANGVETGTIPSFTELIDNINDMFDVLSDNNGEDAGADEISSADNSIRLVTEGFTDAGFTPIEVKALNVDYMNSTCIYAILDDTFAVSVVNTDAEGFIAGYLHENGMGVVSALSLDDLIAESVKYITGVKVTTQKPTRVYISKMYCDDAGFNAGTKLKISTKNQRVVAITKGKDDDYNYTVNADGRIRISSTYLEAIGLNEENMKITAYNGMIA